MPTNLARRIVVNGEPHLIDYSALENRPFGVARTTTILGPETMELSDDGGSGVYAFDTTAFAGVVEGDSLTITVGSSTGTFAVFRPEDAPTGYLAAGNDEFVAALTGPSAAGQLGVVFNGTFANVMGPSGTQSVTVAHTAETRLDGRYLPVGLLDGLYRQAEIVVAFDDDVTFTQTGAVI